MQEGVEATRLHFSKANFETEKIQIFKRNAQTKRRFYERCHGSSIGDGKSGCRISSGKPDCFSQRFGWRTPENASSLAMESRALVRDSDYPGK
jgi:hypothetical protein